MIEISQKECKEKLDDLLKRVKYLESIIKKKKAITKKMGYNEKMAFSMPRQLNEDKRRVIVLVDLPNIVNTALNEKATKGEDDANYFDAHYLEILLEKYVLIYGDNVDTIKIFTTPDYQKINEDIAKFDPRIEMVEFAKLDADKKKWLDMDSTIINYLSGLYNVLSVEDSHVSRILLFSGDGDYYDSVANIVQDKKIPFYVISHIDGFSPLWKQLISVNHDKIIKRRHELLFTYRYYDNDKVEGFW